MRRIETSTYNMILIAIFAALLTVCNYLARIEIGPVPITLQLIPVILAGAILGSWRGATAIIIVILLNLFHIPTFPGRVGLGVITGITFGYIIGWIFAAYIVGLIIPGLWKKKKKKKPYLWEIVFVLSGVIFICLSLYAKELLSALFMNKDAYNPLWLNMIAQIFLGLMGVVFVAIGIGERFFDLQKKRNFIVNIKVFLVCSAATFLIVYSFGVLWAAIFFGKSAIILWKYFVIPFIIPDLIKMGIVTYIIYILQTYGVIRWNKEDGIQLEK